MKLPKESLLNGQENKIELFLEAHQVPLWTHGTTRVALIKFDEQIQKAISAARRGHQLKAGLENIETLMDREEKGIQINRTRGASSKNVSISRLLLMSNDGSERFYRNCDSLLSKHRDRIMGCKLEASSSELGESFFGENLQVKAILITNKSFVARTLLAMLPNEIGSI